MTPRGDVAREGGHALMFEFFWFIFVSSGHFSDCDYVESGFSADLRLSVELYRGCPNCREVLPGWNAEACWPRRVVSVHCRTLVVSALLQHRQAARRIRHIAATKLALQPTSVTPPQCETVVIMTPFTIDAEIIRMSLVS